MGIPFIKTENLCFTYKGDIDCDDFPVLHDINLEVQKGEFIAILGRNGSGKSTLAKLLNMILTPDSGSIYIDGINIARPDITEDEVMEIRRRIGMVFQNPDNQLVATIVEEDIAFGPENLGVPPEEIRRRVDEALEIVGMKEFARHSPHQLSGGQKQRIAIAGIIAMMPECIIFDESTAMLDPMGRQEVMNTIEELNRNKGITVITITHNMEEAIHADRVIVVDQGHIIIDDKPRHVFSQIKMLDSIGLTVPQVTQLFYELKKSGVNIPVNVLDAEEGADIMYEVLKG